MTKFYIEKILLNINDRRSLQDQEVRKLKIKILNYLTKTLIAHSIISKKSRYIKEVYLITDSMKIAKIKKIRAKVPF